MNTRAENRKYHYIYRPKTPNMIGIHSKSINIDRITLLIALRENLTVHETEYTEALTDYRVFIGMKLEEALKQATDGTPEEVAKIKIEFNPPQDHRKDYLDVIEMLEYSVDETIQLDQQSFKAYVKNEWLWTESFKIANSFYKAGASK